MDLFCADRKGLGLTTLESAQEFLAGLAFYLEHHSRDLDDKIKKKRAASDGDVMDVDGGGSADGHDDEDVMALEKATSLTDAVNRITLKEVALQAAV